MSRQSSSSASSPKRAKGAQRGRPPRIDTEALLEVAREVFLERGVRATTLEVARRAGISEGAVFHRFKTKDALFRAAMGFDPLDLPQFIAETIRSLEGLEVEEALTLLATRLLEKGRVVLPLMMMSWSNPDFMSPEQCDRDRGVYQQMLKEFAAYYEAQMEAGKLRRMDAEVFIRVFIGAVHHYGMTRIFAQEAGEYMLPEGTFIRGLVDLLLHGTLPAPQSSEAVPPYPRRQRAR